MLDRRDRVTILYGWRMWIYSWLILWLKVSHSFCNQIFNNLLYLDTSKAIILYHRTSGDSQPYKQSLIKTVLIRFEIETANEDSPADHPRSPSQSQTFAAGHWTKPSLCWERLYSHVRVLERGRRGVDGEPGGGLHCGLGEVQLQGFTFTWRDQDRDRSRSPQHAHCGHTVGSTSWCKQRIHTVWSVNKNSHLWHVWLLTLEISRFSKPPTGFTASPWREVGFRSYVQSEWLRNLSHNLFIYEPSINSIL